MNDFAGHFAPTWKAVLTHRVCYMANEKNEKGGKTLENTRLVVNTSAVTQVNPYKTE